MPRRIYLDHNATSPLRPEARAAMLDALETLGNPSSVHAEGRAAKALLEGAREVVSEAVGAPRRGVVFTSGATEAASLALSPTLRREGDGAPVDALLVGAGEHLCVLQGRRFPPGAVETLPLTREGAISIEALEKALARRSPHHPAHQRDPPRSDRSRNRQRRSRRLHHGPRLDRRERPYPR